jgi:ABC-type ATPase with predicted acetyltransferase domain
MNEEIAWVSALLSRWGRWSIKAESGALGFASMSMIASDYQEGDGYDMRIPKGVQDEDMEAINMAVGKLPHVLLVIVIEVYQRHPRRKEYTHSRTLGISVYELRKYLFRAQTFICREISLKNSLTSDKNICNNVRNYASGETSR